MSEPKTTWPTAMATVLTCHYEIGAGQAMAFGVPTSKHFHITYNYWAANPSGASELHTGDFYSGKAIPQNTLFPITYNPEAPHENTHTNTHSISTRNPIFAIGIIGSLILTTAWFLFLHGCH